MGKKKVFRFIQIVIVFTKRINEHDTKVENVKDGEGDEELIESIDKFFTWENKDGEDVRGDSNYSKGNLWGTCYTNPLGAHET